MVEATILLGTMLMDILLAILLDTVVLDLVTDPTKQLFLVLTNVVILVEKLAILLKIVLKPTLISVAIIAVKKDIY